MKKRLVLVSHPTKKDVISAVENTFEEGETEVVYMDNVAKYAYMENGWYDEVYERMVESISRIRFDDYGEVYFVAVGFIPAVLVAYDVLVDNGIRFDLLTHNALEEMYDRIEWRKD